MKLTPFLGGFHHQEPTSTSTAYKQMSERLEYDPLAETVIMMIMRLKRNLSCTAMVTGEPGSGKSTLGIRIGMLAAQLTGVKWAWKPAVTYDGESFLRAVYELPKFSTVILNEAGEALFNREWQAGVNKAISKSQLSDRVYRKLKVFIIPYASMSDINLRRTAHYHFHCQAHGEARHTTITKAVQPDPDTKYSTPYKRTICQSFRFPPLPDYMYDHYDALDLAAKEAMNQKYRESLTKQTKPPIRTEPPDGLHEMSLTQLAEKHGVSDRTISKWRRKWPLPEPPPNPP